MQEVATICVQTGLNPARYILESPCQYVRCHCLNFFGGICFKGVYGSWFVLVNIPFEQIKSQRAARRTPTFREDWYLVWDVLVAQNWSHLLRRNHQECCICGNLQHVFKSIGRWGTLKWILPAGWSDIPHFTRQHGRNSVFSATASFRWDFVHRTRPI